MNIEKMKTRIMELADPNNPYSQEDFDKEFGLHNQNITDLSKIKITFSNKSDNPDPEYATEGASGFDLRAFIKEPIVLHPKDKVVIPTGLYFNLPPNFEIQIRARSGMAAKYGVTVLNGPGTIDADYRGEIGVILINHGKEDFIINNGDRIAQAIIATVIGKTFIGFNKVNEIENNTERGSSGFGSTGKN